MKIVIIGPAYPYRGGIASYNERMAQAFTKAGHKVTIHTFSLQYPNFLFPGKTQFNEGKAPDNLKIVRSINSISPLNWISVGNKIKNEKPDLVIVRYWLPFMGACLGTILRRISRNRHSKIFSLVDNMIPHEKRIGDKVLSRYFVRPVHAFIAMSQSVINDINTFDKNKPKILTPHPLFDNFGNPMDKSEALAHLKLEKGYKYIMFFGLIRDYKGLDLLIEAFADQRIRKSKIKLIIAGEYYSDRKRYDDLILKYDIEENIIQSDGYIPDEEVRSYFSAVDLIVQPYKSATQSGVTQIAYHFNKPMVVTNVGGLPELCPDGKVGYVVAPNAGAISDAIVKFFKSDPSEFIENVKQEKKKFSWEVLVNRILDLYNKVEI